MANIVRKAPSRKSVIQKGPSYFYNPDTFKSQPNFFESTTAAQMLLALNPFQYMGRKFLFIDTETHVYYKHSHDVPTGVVRRWVGSGKSAHPQDYPFCISICDGMNCYVLYDSVDNDFSEMKKLKVLLEDPTIEKVIHNAKFDMTILVNAGIKIVGKIHDTVIMAKLADENRFSFALIDLAAKANGIVMYEYMIDNYKSQFKIGDYRNFPHDLLTAYASEDVWNLYKIFITEYPKLIKDELLDLYEQELRVMMAFWAMERWGMHSDESYEAPLKEDMQAKSNIAEQAIYDYVGYTFNINSGKQLYAAMLSTGVNKSLIAMSDKDNPVLDKAALTNLSEVHGVEIVIRILEYRKYEKLLGTYANGIYEQRDANQDIHCSINQTEATTGRSSITKPALQTLPKKDKSIRRIFIPHEGYDLAFMDLDQVEYRGFAHYARAEGLIEAIKNGHDVHTATAAIVFNVSYSDVTEEQRQKAKTTNFGLIYGQGEELTAASLKMTRADARRFREHYFAVIPEARPFIDTVQAVIVRRGYIRNFYGRRRRLKSDEAYKGPNALIQSWAADYAKSKIVDIFCYLLINKLMSRIVNFVHDELVEEIHNTERHIIPTLRWLLSEFEAFRVPITASVDYGNPSWGQKINPESEVGFNPLSKEEMECIRNYDLFDGSVFDLFE